jgi:hypothetical protein
MVKLKADEIGETLDETDLTSSQIRRKKICSKAWVKGSQMRLMRERRVKRKSV